MGIKFIPPYLKLFRIIGRPLDELELLLLLDLLEPPDELLLPLAVPPPKLLEDDEDDALICPHAFHPDQYPCMNIDECSLPECLFKYF
jgi:hypothetical protein